MTKKKHRDVPEERESAQVHQSEITNLERVCQEVGHDAEKEAIDKQWAELKKAISTGAIYPWFLRQQ